MANKQRTDFSYSLRAAECVAQGALTNSKHPNRFVKGVYPTHIKRASGCLVECNDGKTYIDFICGLGTQLYGYNNPKITAAIKKELDKGLSYSLPSTLEVEFLELAKGVFNCERFKILKSGSDACTAAIKIARAHTGKQLVLSSGYHGWHPEFTSLTPPAAGCCDYEMIAPLNEDTKQLSDIAAIIVEPPFFVHYFEKLRYFCDQKNILLILDETITALRSNNLSYAKNAGIYPDLWIGGKALGGGMPIALLGGKAQMMDNPEYFVSTTFAGENASIAAANCVLELALHDDKHTISNLIDQFAEFIGFFGREFEGTGVELKKLDCSARATVKTDTDLHKALFLQECCKQRLLVGPSLFFSFAHEKHMMQIKTAFATVADLMRRKDLKIEGEMPTPAFPQKLR